MFPVLLSSISKSATVLVIIISVFVAGVLYGERMALIKYREAVNRQIVAADKNRENINEKVSRLDARALCRELGGVYEHANPGGWVCRME